jgi:alkylation response protein AidB-like acyl-CoA dehydrogenase
VKLVQDRGRAADPMVRQKIAALWIGEQALMLNAYRSLTRILRGGQPGPEGSTSKLTWSQLDQELAQTATEVLGPYSQIAPGSALAPDEGQWEFYALLAQASGIRAGTTEILKNILGERVLGLPKD